MAENQEPYIPHEPGDLITAEDWNQVQVAVKEDMCQQIEDAKSEIASGSVKHAENADRFADQNEKEWLARLDERYADKAVEHETKRGYRRFIKTFNSDLNKVLLAHNLGRYPLVDIYRLKSVTDEEPFNGCKILVYYGHADADKYKLQHQVYREKVKLGFPLEKLLEELAVDFDEDDTLEDVINDLWEAFCADPNDEIDHCVTPWIEDCCNKKRTVAELKRANQWPDLHVAMLPCDFCCVQRMGDGFASPLEYTHANYQQLYIEVEEESFDTNANGEEEELVLMILLRA